MPFGFRRKHKQKRRAQTDQSPHNGLWMRCDFCSSMIYRSRVEELLFVCPDCNYHFPIPAVARIEQLLDEGSFREEGKEFASADPLLFEAKEPYAAKLKAEQERTGLTDAAVYGTGEIHRLPVVLCVIDQSFLMGSMGSVVGEKICRAAEVALARRRPLVIVSGSGGGARMQEGIFSLMQMAKTAAVLARLAEERVPYISVLTHPTMGGSMASFASLGDVVIAEPKALLGFTGPKVIQQTIGKELPEGFQRAEFLEKHGMVDMIVQRDQLRDTLATLITYLTPTTEAPPPRKAVRGTQTRVAAPSAPAK
ncbi:MAG: acetyl-CoA carboxylase carboxyltransferase subunit beta [Planctomycetes bacterium]|nr:acetyl-CoA carboxylase carboxyltransferase subunit beta [Planctomycetota bacterium]